MADSKKVLVVEDDRFLAKIYETKFKLEKIETILAFNGEEGLNMVEAKKPDIILLDLVMPKMDGFTFLEEIKKKPEFSKIPIIVMSNLGQDEDVEKAMNMGAEGYMIKADHSMGEVVAKVKEYI